MSACGSSGNSSAAESTAAQSAASSAATASVSSASSTVASGDTSAASTGTAVESGTVDELDVGTSEDLGYLQWGSTTHGCGPCFYLVYDPIFYYKDGKRTSDVLEDYHIADDGYTLVMKLRNDVYFSNGAQAKGEDLLYSFLCNLDPKRSSTLAESWYKYLDSDNSYVDDDGFTVYLKTKDATMASQIGNLTLCPLMCKSWCEEVGWDSDKWYSDVVGSGPYKVTDYMTDNYYVFTLRDDWWMAGKESMPAKVIKYTAYSEKSTLFMDLEGGNIDLAISIDASDYDRASDDKGITATTLEGDACSWLVFDEDNSAFSDDNLRAAICYGVNWDEVATAGKGSLWNKASSSIPSYFPAYENVGNYEYDLNKAKEYLAKTDYANGGLTLYSVVTNAAVPSATVLQSYLAALGITYTFDALDISSVITARGSGTGDLDFYSYSGGSPALDAGTLFGDLASTGRVKNVATADTKVNDLLSKANNAKTEEEMYGYYQDLQKYLYDSHRLVSYLENVDACAFDNSVISSVSLSNRQYPNLRNIVFVQK